MLKMGLLFVVFGFAQKDSAEADAVVDYDKPSIYTGKESEV